MRLLPTIATLDRFFQISERGTTVRKEAIAGLTTFGAMAYIMAVNPAVLAQTGLAVHDMIMTTLVATIAGTLLMALGAKMPIALAPAMSSNAIFAQVIVCQMGVDVFTAFTIVLIGGIAVTLLAVTKLRRKIVAAFPQPVVIGIQLAIGIFIARLGMISGHLVKLTPSGYHFGAFDDSAAQVTLFGLFITAAFVVARMPAGLLFSIVIVTVLGFFVQHDGRPLTKMPQHFMDWPYYPHHLFFSYNFHGVFSHLTALLPITLYLILTDFFDSSGTMFSILRRAGLTQSSAMTELSRSTYAADGAASILGSALGTSTVSAYVESLAGVEAGGRTGLTSATVALLFALSSVFWPLLIIIPPEATAPILILVGLGMLSALTGTAQKSQDALLTPALMLLMAVLTGNFMVSLAIGFMFHSVLLIAKRQFQTLTPMLVGLNFVFIFYLILVGHNRLSS